MKKVAVVLSGSGVYDGSELHEAVLTLLHLDEQGADAQCFAPDQEQMHVVDHLKGSPVKGQSRNMLVESARIARGAIKPLSELKAKNFDALILPGGFGAAKNLSTFAVDGVNCRVNEQLTKLILDFHSEQKPIAPMCIAPAVIARVLGARGIMVKLTTGDDPGTANTLRAMGAEPVYCKVDEICVDEQHKIVSTPAYMLGTSIKQVNKGIGKLVKKVLELAQGS